MAAKYKIHALVNGEFVSSLGQILFKDALALNLPKEKVAPYGWSENLELRKEETIPGVMVPVIVWLIEGPGGPILVDTGMPDCEEIQRVISAHEGGIKHCRQKPEWMLGHQLGRFGLTPNDIETVILTHLHGDHYGNNELFTRARFYVHQVEVPLCLAPPPWAPFYRPGYRPHLLKVLDQVVLLSGDYKLRDGVQLVHVGGHSPGLFSVLVDTEIGRIALASDLIHSYKNLELNWPIASFWDLNQVIAGMQLLNRCADIVLPNHDWQLWELYPDGKVG